MHKPADIAEERMFQITKMTCFLTSSASAPPFLLTSIYTRRDVRKMEGKMNKRENRAEKNNTRIETGVLASIKRKRSAKKMTEESDVVECNGTKRNPLYAEAAFPPSTETLLRH